MSKMATKADIESLKKDMDSKLDRVESRLARIEQNHLDRITQLHAQPKQSNP